MVDRDRDRARRGVPPAGWSLLATGSELVLRHDRPCHVTGALPGANRGAPAGEVGARAAAAAGPVVTIELRYPPEVMTQAQHIVELVKQHCR